MATQQETVVEFILPEGLELQTSHGKVSGLPLFKIAGLDMPWCGSPAEAYRTYSALKKAIDTGYFDASVKRAAHA